MKGHRRANQPQPIGLAEARALFLLQLAREQEELVGALVDEMRGYADRVLEAWAPDADLATACDARARALIVHAAVAGFHVRALHLVEVAQELSGVSAGIGANPRARRIRHGENPETPPSTAPAPREGK